MSWGLSKTSDRPQDSLRLEHRKHWHYEAMNWPSSQIKDRGIDRGMNNSLITSSTAMPCHRYVLFKGFFKGHDVMHVFGTSCCFSISFSFNFCQSKTLSDVQEVQGFMGSYLQGHKVCFGNPWPSKRDDGTSAISVREQLSHVGVALIWRKAWKEWRENPSRILQSKHACNVYVYLGQGLLSHCNSKVPILNIQNLS